MKFKTFDIETWGINSGDTLQPWKCEVQQSGVLCLAVYDGTVSRSSGWLPDLEAMRRLLESTDDVIFCGWNLKFDLAYLIAAGMYDYLKNKKFLDGMLLLKRIDSTLPTYGLKATLERYADHVDYIKEYNKGIAFKSGDPNDVYTSPEADAMMLYNEQDAEYTHKIIQFLIKKASKQDIKMAVLESTAAFLFADSWQRGILLDKHSIKVCQASVNRKIDSMERVFLRLNLSKKIISSPLQLQKYLVNNLKARLTTKTPTGNLAVGAKVLKNLYYKSEGNVKKVIKLIINYKELLTEKNKFIDSALDCATSNKYMHPEPMLSGTYTGRVTYSIYQTIKEQKSFKNGSVKEVNKKIKLGIPIHQIKKKGDIRNIFVAPKDHFIMELDFSAQEMRLIACIADEPTMIRLFNEQKDMHAYTAAKIAGVTYDEFQTWKLQSPEKYKDLRFLGKLTNLSLQYRLSAEGLYRQWHDVYGLTHKSIDDATVAKNTYLEIYSNIRVYWNKSINNAMRLGYTVNMAGRKHFLTDWGGDNKFSSEQTSINYPIQSTGAEQKILALTSLRDVLNFYNIKFAWDLHDGLYFYVPHMNNELDVVNDIIRRMSTLPYDKAWGWEPQIDFPVEAKIGDTWGSLKSI